MGPVPSGRLKNLKDIDKWSSLNLYLPVRGMSVTWGMSVGAIPVQSDGFNSTLCPVVFGDIALSINTIQYNTKSKGYLIRSIMIKRYVSPDACQRPGAMSLNML